MWFRRIAAVAALSLVAACSAPMHGFYVPLTHYTAYTPARPLIAENRIDPYDGELPACADPYVLDKIQKQFTSREVGYWDSSLVITDFQAPYEIAYRPRGATFIPRRYCSVTGVFSDYRSRKIYYSVDEDTGFLSFGWGVTWCPVGLDRDLTYAPGCKMARP